MKPSSAAPLPLKMRPVDLSAHWNWPRRVRPSQFWRALADDVRRMPSGEQRPWGIPFLMGETGARTLLLSSRTPPVEIPVRGKATFLCMLHTWRQIPATVRMEAPQEGRVVAEYEVTYSDGATHLQPIRSRFEVEMVESPGPPWMAVRFTMPESLDPVAPPDNRPWGYSQLGISSLHGNKQVHPLLYAMPNPCPDKTLRRLTLRGKEESPLLIAGLTLYAGTGHPLRHLPRRLYRVKTPGGAPPVTDAEVDLGTVTRIEHTRGPRDKRWVESPYAGLQADEPERQPADLIEVVGAEDATLTVKTANALRPHRFPVGETFRKGKSLSGRASLEVLGRERQWMQVSIVDASTGRPTPARVHISGPRGEYLPPYGHHAQVNANWFEDYGADLRVGSRNFAYVPGAFTTDMPLGDVYVEICKGFEYRPVRKKVTIRRGQKKVAFRIGRWVDLRNDGWVTADTHVHFLSPHTAWLEAQGEGINVVNLLASQWGRLFTNVGDLAGKPGVVQDDTIVFVGTENRNHMLGHMSMLGTKDLPVFPMCCGGVSESWIGDPDFRTLAEWALENRAKGGVVIRPHYPFCGHTEDPVPILKGLVDALEIRGPRGDDFPTQEWYRYLNCGYRVAVCGGTDKMSAGTALGWTRTYAKLDAARPFTYAAWARAVRAGRTFSTTGPLIDFSVEGLPIGDTLRMGPNGGTLGVTASARCFVPLSALEVIFNGRVVARAARRGAATLAVRDTVKVTGSGWLAARCRADKRHPGNYMAAHTSPIYVQCGRYRPFSGPAAQHMLSLVEGGIEYLNTLATHFDEPSRKRMVKLFNEARRELKGRWVVEGKHTHAHGRSAHRH